MDRTTKWVGLNFGSPWIKWADPLKPIYMSWPIGLRRAGPGGPFDSSRCNTYCNFYLTILSSWINPVAVELYRLK